MNDIDEIIEQNKSLKDQLATLSYSHAEHRQRLDEMLMKNYKEKNAMAEALNTEPIYWEMMSEIRALKRNFAESLAHGKNAGNNIPSTNPT
jgi:hypothetical protein